MNQVYGRMKGTIQQYLACFIIPYTWWIGWNYSILFFPINHWYSYDLFIMAMFSCGIFIWCRYNVGESVFRDFMHFVPKLKCTIFFFFFDAMYASCGEYSEELQFVQFQFCSDISTHFTGCPIKLGDKPNPQNVTHIHKTSVPVCTRNWKRGAVDRASDSEYMNDCPAGVRVRLVQKICVSFLYPRARHFTLIVPWFEGHVKLLVICTCM